MANKQSYWFKRRRYGWGWIPVTWQGWLVLGVYLAIAVIAAGAFLSAPEETDRKEEAIYFLILTLLTISLIRISYSKGPRPRWRWGKSPQDNPEEDF